MTTLVDKIDPFFLDMAINISIAVFKGHGFFARTASFLINDYPRIMYLTVNLRFLFNKAPAGLPPCRHPPLP